MQVGEEMLKEPSRALLSSLNPLPAGAAQQRQKKERPAAIVRQGYHSNPLSLSCRVAAIERRYVGPKETQLKSNNCAQICAKGKEHTRLLFPPSSLVTRAPPPPPPPPPPVSQLSPLRSSISMPKQARFTARKSDNSQRGHLDVDLCEKEKRE